MKLSRKKLSRLQYSVLFVIVSLAVVGGVTAYWHFSAQRLSNQREPRVESVSLTEGRSSSKKELTKHASFSKLSEIPVRITIDKIGVDAEIVSVGLTNEGLMDAPKNNEQVGWYEQSARAGEGDYAMLLDGHYGTKSDPAVFHNLSDLKGDDVIEVTGGDGAILKYSVREIDQSYTEEVDMQKAFYPYGDTEQSLTIITCEGLYDPVNVSYDERTVLYAERIE